MEYLTVNDKEVYNDRRTGSPCFDAKTTHPPSTSLEIVRSLKLISGFAKLVPVAWQSDLADPLLPPKLKVNESCQSAGYLGAWLLRYILPKDRSTRYFGAEFLYQPLELMTTGIVRLIVFLRAGVYVTKLAVRKTYVFRTVSIWSLQNPSNV